jgi:beta-glucosidase
VKHQNLINKMTLDEKVAFLSGKLEWESRGYERLEIPSIFCSDGPHGIHRQAGAGDWRSAWRRVRGMGGECPTGTEYKEKPSVWKKFLIFSEDPYLSGKMAVSYLIQFS